MCGTNEECAKEPLKDVAKLRVIIERQDVRGDLFFMSSFVEQKYQEALDRMSGRERMERTASLYSSMWEMFALQTKREFGALEGRALRKKVAERFYGSDPVAQQLLKKVGEEG